jgi:integrase
MLLKLLLKRNNTYYFRWQIPQDLRPHFGYELIRSLRTKNQSEALLQLSAYTELVQLIKETRKLMLFREISQEEYLDSIESIKLRIQDKSIALSTISQLNPMSAPLKGNAVIKLSPFINDEFFQYKKSRVGGLSDRAERDYQIDFTKILAVIEDKPLNLYTKQDMQECLSKVLLLPAKNKKPYNKMTYDQILELGEIPEEDLVSLSTADHVKKKLQGIFNTAIDLDLISKNPTDKLDWKAPKKGFGNYTDKEVKVLFEEAQKEIDWKKWLVSIGALSGCRLSEVIHLRGKDLIRDEDTGIYYFNITAEAGSLKTDAANRKVPIHSKLLDIGLLDYRDSIGAKRLFDVKDKAATAWFARYRTRCGIAHVNDKNERRVFHSFRHWVITQARAKVGKDALIQQVVGHEKTSAGATDRYTDEMPMKELKRVIECLDFDQKIACDINIV